MNWVWTWDGIFFGYYEGEDLWTYDGRHAGKLRQNDIFDRNGHYIGEIINENRLITNQAKKGWRNNIFTPYARRGEYAKFANYAGFTMYAGHEDFPLPDKF